jgi:DNA-binding MarR family transcriptional regulator
VSSPRLEIILSEFEKLLHLAHRNLFSSGSVHLNNSDLTIQQFFTMASIYRKESPKMTDLAKELGVTMGNVTALVERLVKQGYLARSGDTEDRRVVRISLTPKGRKIVNKAKELRQKKMRYIVNKINAKDQKALARIITKLIGALQQEKKEVVQ